MEGSVTSHELYISATQDNIQENFKQANKYNMTINALKCLKYWQK